MPLFKVQLEKNLGVSRAHHPNFNPFRMHDIFHSCYPKSTYSVREWEFEAANEEEVREMLREAQEQDFDNVRGYQLRSIELVAP